MKIKLRGYDYAMKTWVDGAHVFYYDTPQCIYMQWSGCTDMDGNDIFEKDILEETESSVIPVTGVVSFKEGRFVVKYRDHKGKGLGTYNVFDRVKHYNAKVIGNTIDKLPVDRED